MTMRARYALAALLLAMTTAGCGKELVVGGQKHVDAAGTGDGTPEGSASKAPAYARLAGPEAAALRAQGTITFTAQVALITDAGRVEQLGSTKTATVKIDGSDSVHIASGDVPWGRYIAARVTFTSVQANVTGGLVIGGVSVTGLVSVGIPGESVVVERAVDLGSPGASARLLVDLDASDWLSAANPATRVVAASTFQSAVKLRTY
jgi:hypothetical protein